MTGIVRELCNVRSALAATVVICCAASCAFPATGNVTAAHADTASTVSINCAVMNFSDHLPEFRIDVTNTGSDPVAVNDVEIAGYSVGQETGSTSVSIGQVITSGQTMTFWSDLPRGWYTDTYHPGLQPDTYAAIPDSCDVIGYS